MSAAAVEKLRDVVTGHALRSATSLYDIESTPVAPLTHGDLRALLSQLDTMERALVVMQTPGDHERRQFCRAYVIQRACADTVLDSDIELAQMAWTKLLTEGC